MDEQKLVIFERDTHRHETLVPDTDVDAVLAQCDAEGFTAYVTDAKTIRVAGRAYTAYLIPGTEAHPCYSTGDVDAAARAISQRRREFTRELRNDPNLARWKVERELDAYEDEAETWRRTG